MARPSKLTPELRDRICALIAAGNSVAVAAEACGISRSTFFAWLERGKRKGSRDRLYREFRDAVAEARAQSEATLVTRIALAAQNGSWQASAWLLERRFTDRWGKASERRRSGDQDDEAQAVDAEIAAAERGFDELAERRRARGA